jgi:hypothetical protein
MGRCEAERVRERAREVGIGRIHKCETNHSMQERFFMEVMVVDYVHAVLTKRLISAYFENYLTEVDTFTVCCSDSLF